MTPSEPARAYSAPLHSTPLAPGHQLAAVPCEAAPLAGDNSPPSPRALTDTQHPRQLQQAARATTNNDNCPPDDMKPASGGDDTPPHDGDSDSPDSNSESTSPSCPPGHPSNHTPSGHYSPLDSQTRVYNSWSKEESTKLIDLVQQYGTNRKWSLIAKHLPGRTGKQCRDRWNNHLRPGLKQGSWTPEEDYVVAYWHSCRGGSWAAIAFWLPGRTAVAIKNHWNAVSKLPDQGNKGTVLVTYTALLRAGLNREDAFDQAVAKVGMPRVRTAVLEQTLAAARVPPNTVVHPPRWDDILTQQAPRQPPPHPHLSSLPPSHHHHLHHPHHHADPELSSTLARLRPLASHPPPHAHPLHDYPHRASAPGFHRSSYPPPRSHPSLSLSHHQYPPSYPNTYHPLLPPKAPPASRPLPDHLTSPHQSAAHSLSTASFLDPADLDPTTGRPHPHPHHPPPRQSTHPAIGSPDSICSVPSITEPHLAPLDPSTTPPPPPATTLRSLPSHPSHNHPSRPPRHPTAPEARSPYQRSKPLSPFQLPTQVLPHEMPPSLLDPLAPPSLQAPPASRDTVHLARQQAAYQILLSRHAGRIDRHGSAPAPLPPSAAAAPSDHRLAPQQPQLSRAASASTLSAHAASSLQPQQQQQHPSQQQQLHAIPSSDSHLPQTSSQVLPSDPPHPTSWPPPSNLSDPTPTSLLPPPASSATLPPLFASDLPPAPPAPSSSHTLAAIEEAALLEWAMTARHPTDPTSATRSAAAAAADLEAAAAWAATGATPSHWRHQHPLGPAADPTLQGGLGDLMDAADARLEALLKREELLEYSAAAAGLTYRDYGSLALRDLHGPVSGYPSAETGSAAAAAAAMGPGYSAGGQQMAGLGGWTGLGTKRDTPDDDREPYGAEGDHLGDGGWRSRVGNELMRNKMMRLGYPPHEGGAAGGEGPATLGQ